VLSCTFQQAQATGAGAQCNFTWDQPAILDPAGMNINNQTIRVPVAGKWDVALAVEIDSTTNALSTLLYNCYCAAGPSAGLQRTWSQTYFLNPFALSTFSIYWPAVPLAAGDWLQVYCTGTGMAGNTARCTGTAAAPMMFAVAMSQVY
jgi:hypothetical protein